jgi:hypothetical protein
MRVGLWVSALVLGLTLVACSGGSSSPTVASLGATGATTKATAPAGGPAPGASVESYTACLRAHGVVNVPDVTPQPGRTVALQLPPAITETAQFAKAATICKPLLPPGTLNPSGTFTTREQQDYLAAADCMRAHDITGFPDPDFSRGSVRFPIPPGVDSSSPSFLQAEQICRKLIPTGLPYSN